MEGVGGIGQLVVDEREVLADHRVVGIVFLHLCKEVVAHLIVSGLCHGLPVGSVAVVGDVGGIENGGRGDVDHRLQRALHGQLAVARLHGVEVVVLGVEVGGGVLGGFNHNILLHRLIGVGAAGLHLQVVNHEIGTLRHVEGYELNAEIVVGEAAGEFLHVEIVAIDEGRSIEEAQLSASDNLRVDKYLNDRVFLFQLLGGGTHGAHVEAQVLQACMVAGGHDLIAVEEVDGLRTVGAVVAEGVGACEFEGEAFGGQRAVVEVGFVGHVAIAEPLFTEQREQVVVGIAHLLPVGGEAFLRHVGEG